MPGTTLSVVGVPMEFSILGPTGLSVAGRSVPLGVAKQRGLLAVLLYHVGRPVRIELIVELLWENRPVDSCRPIIYALTSRLRAVLRSVGLSDVLVRAAGSRAYRLEIDPDLIDHHRFATLVTDARAAIGQARHEHGAALLDTAVGLWRDEPLAELRGVQAEQWRATIWDRLLDAYKMLGESELALGRHDRVLARLEPLLREHHLDETLARLWASALHAAGRGHEARAFVTAFRRRYRREMRAEPTVDLMLDSSAVGLPLSLGRGGGVRDTASVPSLTPRQLPYDVTDFTGRTELIAELDALAADDGGGRVIVLTGTPGVGKTALVTHWGRQRLDRFPDGQLYLDAEGYGPGPTVRPRQGLARFLNALGVPATAVPHDDDERRERYHQLLADRRMLVVIDNVLDSEQARQMLPRSDTCLTIICSRNALQRLTIRNGIRSLTVPPLPVADRRVLLGRIVDARRASTQPEAVATLARLSSGLPLALRVIGKHVKSRPRTSIGELARELSTRLFDYEGDDSDDGVLRSVFDWSVNALEPVTARLFLRLGLFPGSTVGPGAAAALLGAVEPTGAERLLGALVRAHLVDHDTLRRFRMHALLRLYAADRCRREEPTAERREALHRLLDWYLLSAANAVRLLEPQSPPVPDLPGPEATSVTPLPFASDAEAMRWCEAERTNLHAVVRTAAAEGFHRHAWQIAGTMHEVFDRYGQQDDVFEMLRTAVDAATADGHDKGRVGTLVNLGATHFAVYSYRPAAQAFTEALRLARECDFAEAERHCLHNLAAIHLRTGATGRAIGLFEQSLVACRDGGDAMGEAYTLYHLGETHRRLGRYDLAAWYHREALERWDRLGSLRGRSLALVRLAELHLDTGESEAAVARCRLVLDVAGRVSDEGVRCDALVTLADALARLGRRDEAVAQAIRASAVAEELDDSLRRSHALTILAEVYAAAGNNGPARLWLGAALEALGGDDDPERNAVRERLAAVARRLSGDQLSD
ncbi:DNA-binding transcriptional activator of the SARP family [Micromonospora pallida]|uniref:DNA-binding transcriptional activator of the SARP family n=1 Tax=Micromonospora pallida TaxID=145854 RepID=A0A1C6SYK3_9ACTN|nr:DNA-binding transcriptional activator of the SARP family [Micromonospora pallida]